MTTRTAVVTTVMIEKRHTTGVPLGCLPDRLHLIFHVGFLAITRGTRTVRRPERYIGMTNRSLREDRSSLQLLEIESQS
jgi:hypothetical protein